MMRRWMLGLVVGLLVIIIASGNFASTGGIDVPASNAGSVTVPVNIELPVDPCAGEATEDTTSDESLDGQSPDPANNGRTMLGEESEPEGGEPTDPCADTTSGGSDGIGEGEGDGQTGSDPDR